MGVSIHYVALFSFVALLSAGVFLVLLGLRGRLVLDVPRCARCRHQIAGAEFHRSGRCPECGSDLKSQDAISYFVSRRRRGMIVVGVVVGALCVMVPVIDRLITIGTRMTAASTNATNAELVALIGTSKPGDTSAVDEALRRSSANQLSGDEYAALLEAIVVRQERNPGGWLEYSESKFLEDAAAAGHAITQAQVDRLAAAGFGAPTCSVPLKIRENARINLAPQSWESRSDLARTLTLREVRLDGRPLRMVDYQGNEIDGLSTTQPGEVLFERPPGRYRLVSTFDVAATFSPSGVAIGSLAGAPTRPATEELDVEIVSTDAPSWIALASPPARAAEVRAACDVQEVAIDADGGSNGRCALRVDLTPGSVSQLAISFVIVVVVDGVEYDAGWFYAISSPKLIVSSSSLSPVEIPCPATMPRTVRVIARPNQRAVEEHAHLDAIWGEDIVFDAVPVVSGRTSSGATR